MSKMIKIPLDETYSGIHFARYPINQALNILEKSQLTQSVDAEVISNYANLLATLAVELDAVIEETQTLESWLYDISVGIEEPTRSVQNNMSIMILLNRYLAERIRLATEDFYQAFCTMIAVYQVINVIDPSLWDDCFKRTGLVNSMPEFCRQIFVYALEAIGAEADARTFDAIDRPGLELEKALEIIETMIDAFYDDEDDY